MMRPNRREDGAAQPVLLPKPVIRARRRVGGVRLVAWATAGVVAVAVTWGVWRALVMLPWWLVTEVTVVGTKVIEGETVVSAADVTLGVPIFGVDADSVIRRVKELPWVLDADVSRSFSGTFEIRVVERTPVGMIWDDGFHLLDPAGNIVSLDGNPPDVPIVTGMRLDDGKRQENIERIGRVLGLIASLEPLRSAVSEISVADSLLMVLVLQPKGIPVLLPGTPGRDRIVMVASVIAYHPGVLREARYLDARFVGQVAVGS